MSINIHIHDINDYEFKASIDIESNIKMDVQLKNVLKSNLNHLFNLKLYDIVKAANNDINHKYKNYT